MWLVTSTILLPIWDCSEKLTINFAILKGYWLLRYPASSIFTPTYYIILHVLEKLLHVYVCVWKIGEFICKCFEKDKSQIFSQITIHHVLLSSSSFRRVKGTVAGCSFNSYARVVPKYFKMFRYERMGPTIGHCLVYA